MLEQINNDKIIEETAAFWRNMSNVLLSDEEVRQAHTNLAGFFQILNEWDKKTRERQ